MSETSTPAPGHAIIPCGVCGAPAARHENVYQCQKHPGHIADLMAWIFSDCTNPSEMDER